MWKVDKLSMYSLANADKQISTIIQENHFVANVVKSTQHSPSLQIAPLKTILLKKQHSIVKYNTNTEKGKL
jgi:hypothetical protein